MHDLSIRRGETLAFTVQADDLTATTLQFIVSETDGTVLINETENFATVDGDRVASIQTDDTDHEEGDYEFMFVITYSDGVIQKFPQPEDCEDDDCELPVLSICKALDAGLS